MKKNAWKILGFVSLAITLGMGLSVGINKYQSENSHKSYALSKSFKSLDELVEASPIIFKGEFTGEYNDIVQPMEASDGELENVIRVYKVNVQKVFKNDPDHPIEKKSTVEVHQLIGVRGTGDDKSKLLPTVEKEQLKLQNGEYILFLNSGKDKLLYQTSPNHVYKLGKNEKYENIVGGKVSEIDETTLSDKVKKSRP